jgi:adenylate cyclase
LNCPEGLSRWLAIDAPHESVAALFAAFCHEVVRDGALVHRVSLGLEGLHPEVSGWQHVWTREAVSSHETDRATAPTSQSYLHSPTRIVDETERPFRRRLDQPSPHLPLLDELRLGGMTDYVMYPLPFLDRTRTAVISFATSEPDGFDDVVLAELEFAVRLLSPYLERRVLRRISMDLLDTYVGPHTGRRILEGRVERGAVEQIEAAIWFADLRGFTALSETRPTTEVLATLNEWFGVVGEVIAAHGGEILKFIGDAVLAIFPTSVHQDRRTACRRAMSAVEDFTRRTDASNVRRRSRGVPIVAHALVLDVGEVAYGNVGAAHRMDFTVIGPAVNRASRLLHLAKRLDRAVLVSDAVAGELETPLIDLGFHELRDVALPQRVFEPGP